MHQASWWDLTGRQSVARSSLHKGLRYSQEQAMPGPTSTPQLGSCVKRQSLVSEICCLPSGWLAYRDVCTMGKT